MKTIYDLWVLVPLVPVLCVLGVVVLWMYFFGTLYLESKERKSKISMFRMSKWTIFFPLILLSAVIMGAITGIGNVLRQMRHDVID
jgi:hypothetical protein